MQISISNAIQVARRIGAAAAKVITTNLKIWLGFETSSISGDKQITPDKSGNNNVGELFTGKALEFNGTTNKVDFTSFTTPIKCAVFWYKPLVSASFDSILWFGGERSGTKRISNNVGIIQATNITGTDVYVDGVQTTSVTQNQWQRVVVNFDSVTPTDLSFGEAGIVYGNCQLSDIQFYNDTLTTDDIAYDYANPQNLVTDRSGSLITLSNLKGYWALSEGAGSTAYDSSGEGNNGTINGATYEPAQPRITQLGMQNWSKGSNSLTFSEDFSNAVWTKGTGTSVAGGFTDPLGGNTAYKASYNGVGSQPYIFDDSNNTTNMRSLWARTVSGTGQIHLTSHNSNSNSLFNLTTEWQRVSAIPTSGAGIANFYLVDFRGSSNLTEILVWGAQINDVTTLGGYRPTSGSSVPSTTLIPNPTIPTQDIYGSLVRNRLNSFNLDGTGYAEVAEVVGLDVTDFSIEAWVKFDYTYSGSSINVIYVNGGSSLDVNTFALTTDEDNKVRFIVGGTIIKSTTVFSNNNWVHIVGTRESNAMKLYINGDTTPEATGTSGAAVNNALDLLVGKDTQTNRFYKERISDVRLYGASLSADEVENNYNAGLSAHTN